MYKAGAYRANPKVQVIRTGVGVWDDITKGREAALAMIDAGVDVILSRGDGVTLGVIQAGAMRPGVYIIGDTLDQSPLAPNTVIASCIWDFTMYVRNIIDLYKAGKMENKIYIWGIKDGGVKLGINPNLKDKIPQSAMDLINKATEEIKTGKLVLPYITTEQEKPWVPAGGY